MCLFKHNCTVCWSKRKTWAQVKLHAKHTFASVTVVWLNTMITIMCRVLYFFPIFFIVHKAEHKSKTSDLSILACKPDENNIVVSRQRFKLVKSLYRYEFCPPCINYPSSKKNRAGWVQFYRFKTRELNASFDGRWFNKKQCFWGLIASGTFER